MDEKSLESLTEGQRKLHEEFTKCQNWDELEALYKKMEKLNESCNDNWIPPVDMTAEEFCKKYGLVSIEEIMERNGIQ